MVKEEELGERQGEFKYVERMSAFYERWIADTFARDVKVLCDEMVTRRRGILNRLDTHTLVRDHKSRGESTYHFYLCHFRPLWTDCTCEGYHAENFGMTYWQSPQGGDVIPFLAEKNCTLVSHELSHEFLRQGGYKRFVPDVHDIWMRHYHAGLPFESYDGEFRRTSDTPVFMTLDASTFRNHTGSVP